MRPASVGIQRALLAIPHKLFRETYLDWKDTEEIIL